MKVYPRKLRNGLPINEMLSCLSKRLRNYYEAGELCDVTIKCTVDDVTLFAHKLILSAMSPFFHNALIGPLSTKDEVELPFTSITVRLLLDCLYQYHDEHEPFKWETEMVDIIEFVHLATYLDMRPLVKHGLRVAASHLGSEWCLDRLIHIYEPGANPIPHQWNDIVLRYVVDYLQYNYLSHEVTLYDSYIKRLSPDVVRLLCCTFLEYYHPLHHVKFIDKLLQSFLDNHSQIEKENDMAGLIDLKKSFENLVSLTKDTISMIDYVVNKDVPKKKMNVFVLKRPKHDNDVLIQMQTVTSYDDDTDTFSNIKAWEVDYAWNPKRGKLIMKEDLSRFSNSLSEIVYEASSYAGMHREDERKYFMWGGSLYSAHYYLETRETQLMMYVIWERYDWVKGRWLKAIHTGPGLPGQGQLTVVENGLDFPGHIVSCISWEMFSFTLCYNRFAQEVRLVIGHDGQHFSTYFFHQEADANRMQMVVATDMYMEDVKLLVFFTPLSVCILPIAEEMDDENDFSDVELAHPEENFETQHTIGKIISLNNAVFHFYSKKFHEAPCEGIHVDRLDLKTKTWIKLEDICTERKLVDAFILNGEIYLMFTKFERETVHFIAQCVITDNLIIQLVRSSERVLKDSEDDDNDVKVQRFVVPKSVLPLDFV